LKHRVRPKPCVEAAAEAWAAIGRGAFPAGAARVRNVIAFSVLAFALAFCAWRQVGLALDGWPHLAASEMLFAGGVFTLAIAVIIRD